MDLREMSCENDSQIEVAHDHFQWGVLILTVLEDRFL